MLTKVPRFLFFTKPTFIHTIAVLCKGLFSMAAQNNAPLPDGLEIAGYRIVKKIASGGFSIVYLAYDAEGSAVAIKEYLPSALALRAPGGIRTPMPEGRGLQPREPARLLNRRLG